MGSVSQIVESFFSSSPKNLEGRAPQKTSGNHLIEYLETRNGAWDFTRVCDLFFTYCHTLPLLSDAHRLTAKKISGIFSFTGSALSVSQLVNDSYAWGNSVKHFFTSWRISNKNALRNQKISYAAKKALVDSSNLGNTVAQSLTFFHEAKLLNLVKQLPLINFVSCVTSFFSDGVECIQEAFKVSRYEAKLGHRLAYQKVTRLEGKLRLAWMKIAQATASIASAVIGLGALATGVVVTSVPLLSATCLALSTIWLTLKITVYFYDKQLQVHSSK